MADDPLSRLTEDTKKMYLSFPRMQREFQPALEGDASFVFLDFETTGFDPRRDRVIEVGAVKVEGERVVDRLGSLIDPGRPIPTHIRLLTGIDDSMVAGRPSIKDFFPSLEAFIGRSQVVGYSRFEETFLRVLYPACAGRPFSNPYIDAMDLAIMLMPSLRSHRQVDLAALWDIEAGNEHRAEDDVEALASVFGVLMNGLYNLPLPVLKALVDHGPAEAGGFSILLRRVMDERSGGRPVDRLRLGDAVKRDRFWEEIPPLVGEEGAGFVQPEEVRAFFEEGGPLASQFSDYEGRDEQVTMSEETRRAFVDGEILLVEAGTGTGKSLAYLVPAVLWARSRGMPVVVSTKTLNLQDQLFTKDLPLLEGAFGEGSFRYAVLKGYSNYLCLRKMQGLIDGRKNLAEDQVGILGMLLGWMAEGGSGDVSLLNVSHLRGLNYQVLADYRECAGERCQFAREGDCFYRKALYRAKRSHIVVVNHSLLLTGVNLPFESVVIDEAHTLEDVATDQFTLGVEYSGTRRFLEFLFTPWEGAGFLVDLPAGLAGHLPPLAKEKAEQLVIEAQGNVATCFDDLDRVFEALSAFFKGSEEYDSSDIRFSTERVESLEYSRLESEARILEASLDRLLVTLGRTRLAGGEGQGDETPDLDSLMLDLDGQIARVEELKISLMLVFDTEDRERVRWATVAPPDRLTYQSLKSTPVDVGPELDSELYEQLSALVMTSATLTVNGSFDFFCSRVGLDLVPGERLRRVVLDSSFDFDRQMQILVLHDMPHPNSPAYSGELSRVLGEVIRASDGGVLALFTNRRLMADTYGSLVDDLSRDGLRLLCQLPGHSRRRLAEQFVEDDKASLFGTSSFWEGVDARGDTLRLVVVTRIPFESPGRPVFEARAERLSSEGLSDFNQLNLPLAALRLKQGVGRLIRTRSDRGQALILDSRVSSERYGKVLMRSLPRGKRRNVSMDEVKRAISDFRDR